MTESLEDALAAELAQIEAEGRLRSTDRTTVGIDLTSNDYLGLSRDARVVEAARRALERHGAGAGAARLLAGPTPEHELAESRVAEWLGAASALLFPSGYQANHGLLGALAGRGDAILSDRLIHASLVDAARGTRADVAIHGHLDLEHLERDLRAAAGARRRLVLTEGVFSMDGDRTPIAELCELCARHDAWLVVDEAHSAGLLGPRGAGVVAEAEQLGADVSRVAARVVTGGKSFGSAGALVVGGSALREICVNRGRAFVFTTAPTPSVAASLAAAIEIAAEDAELRTRCLDAARGLAACLGLPEPAAAIVPWVIGGNRRTLEVADRLTEAGFGVRAVRWPTVPRGEERIRLVGHAHNGVEEIEAFGRAVAAWGDALSAGPGRGLDSASESGSPGPPSPSPPTPTPLAGTGVARFGHRGDAGGTTRPAPAFVVAGTDTDIGKTVLSAIALCAARRVGPAGYWKPVQTGSDSDTETVTRLADAQGDELSMPLRHYPLPASPHEAAADVGQEVPVELLTPALDELRARDPARRWIVELAGGLLVPYRMDALQLEWLQEIRLPLLFGARSSLGTLNHTLLSVRAARDAGVPIAALFLIGDRHPSNHATLIELAGIEHVFEVPRFDSLERRSLEAWLDDARSHRGMALEDLIAASRPQPRSVSADHTAR